MIPCCLDAYAQAKLGNIFLEDLDDILQNEKTLMIRKGFLENKLKEISQMFKVGNISRDEKNIYVRVISDTLPNGYDYKLCKPDLEDLYLYFFD